MSEHLEPEIAERRSKLTVKLGPHEFHSEGRSDAVSEAFRKFVAMIVPPKKDLDFDYSI